MTQSKLRFTLSSPSPQPYRLRAYLLHDPVYVVLLPDTAASGGQASAYDRMSGVCARRPIQKVAPTSKRKPAFDSSKDQKTSYTLDRSGRACGDRSESVSSPNTFDDITSSRLIQLALSSSASASMRSGAQVAKLVLPARASSKVSSTMKRGAAQQPLLRAQ